MGMRLWESTILAGGPGAGVAAPGGGREREAAGDAVRGAIWLPSFDPAR